MCLPPTHTYESDNTPVYARFSVQKNEKVVYITTGQVRNLKKKLTSINILYLYFNGRTKRQRKTVFLYDKTEYSLRKSFTVCFL